MEAVKDKPVQPPKESIKARALNILRRMCWKDKYFVGTYWDTEAQLRAWVKNNPVIVLRKIRENVEFVDYDVKNTERLSLAKSVRVRNKQANKQRRVHVIYVEDNAYTKLLGYNKTKEHLTLEL